MYISLIGKLPTPLDATGFSVCTQLEDWKQVIRPCSDWLVAYLSCVGDNDVGVDGGCVVLRVSTAKKQRF